MCCRRSIRLVLLTLFILALAAAQAAAWGPATHAYIADHAGKRWPYLNRTEIYGALLPDACYFAYGLEYQDECALVAHEQYMGMWEGQRSLRGRALGLGYVSHNWEWGADRTAHDDAFGYVVRKATYMADELGGHPLLGALPFPLREAIAHTVIEAATDILLKRQDPFIGHKLTLSTLLRGAFVPQQYVAAYAGELAQETGLDQTQAAVVLAQIEAGFRGAMVTYGLALMKDEQAAVDTLAQQFAPLAEYWGVDLPPAVVEPLIRELILGAMALCEVDFPPALAATTALVRQNLWDNGVWY